MKHHFWEAICSDERQLGINKIQEIVSRFGSLIDFKLFSDISISMVIELSENKMNLLYNSLSTYMKVEREVPLNEETNKEICLYLNITFTKGKGDQQNVSPEVPG